MWLLDASTRRVIEGGYKTGAYSIERQMEFEARHFEALEEGESRVLTVANSSEAVVSIRGVMTNAPDFMASIFGGGNVTYGEITAALATADADDSIERVRLDIDSPGGQFDGLFDTLAALQSFSKPIRAVISNLGASAAFAIAAQADEIEASNPAARIGSVGVVATFDVYDSEVIITSTDAPKKRPDVTTAEGQGIIREELDAMHEIFVEAIAAGRKTSNETVNAEFGQGATLLAGEALKRGMIDSIAKPVLKAVNTTKTSAAHSGGKHTEATMDIKNLVDLKAQLPDVYTAAMQAGIDQERDRVTAHLTMGASSGDTKTAYEAIKAGSGMTATLQAAYMVAGMNRNDIKDRASDDVSANAGDGANAGGGDNDDAAKEKAGQDVLNFAANACGVEMGAE